MVKAKKVKKLYSLYDINILNSFFASLSFFEPILTFSNWIKLQLIFFISITRPLWSFGSFSWSFTAALSARLQPYFGCWHEAMTRAKRVWLVRILDFVFIHRDWKLIEYFWSVRIHWFKIWKKWIFISYKTLVKGIVRVIRKRIKSNRVVFMSVHLLTVVARTSRILSVGRWWYTAGVFTVFLGWLTAWMWRESVGRVNGKVVFWIHWVLGVWVILESVSDKDVVNFVNYYRAWMRELISLTLREEFKIWELTQSI